MLLRRSDDPIRDYELYDDDWREQLEKLPECAECGNKIFDDHLYRIEGRIYCQECIDGAKEYLY